MINDTTFFYIFFYKVGKTIMVCFKKNKVFFTLRASICGESGIRTHGTISDTHAFQACSFSHSDISPIKLHVLKCMCSLIQFLTHLYTLLTNKIPCDFMYIFSIITTHSFLNIHSHKIPRA